jgi:DNA-binding GntR family transcriptional regulator
MYTASYAAGRRSDLVHSELKKQLLEGHFAIGVRLGEMALAEEFGVSRTPVREALSRLWSEGIVDRHPEGGFRPVPPDVSVIRDLYEVRVGLEQLAIARPFRIGTVHERERLLELRDDWMALAEDPDVEPSPDFVLLDESFHAGLAEASGNPAIVEMLRTVNERIRIVRMQDFLTEERISKTITQHLGILEAVIDRDLATAMARFDDHLHESLAVVEERAMQAVSRMIRVEGEGK